jgi:hypothetical protein
LYNNGTRRNIQFSLDVVVHQIMKTKNLKIQSHSATFKFLVFVLPGTLFFIVGARPIEPMNGQDGYVYIGIVARTTDFLLRFPDSYFGMRFGYIFPSNIFHWIFGFEIGHHLIRFVFLGCIALLLTIRGQIQKSNVIVMVVLLSLSPIVLVSTFSTYTMSLGALFLLSGILIVAIYRTDDSWDFFWVGTSSALLAMAWNSHLQLLLPSAVLLATIIIDRVLENTDQRIKSLLWYSIAGLCGTAIVCAFGVLVMGSRYGIWNPWAPSLEFVSGDAEDAFKSSGLDWIAWRHYVLLVPMSICVGTAVWMTEKNQVLRSVVKRLTLAITSLFLVYVFYQWGVRSIALETYFHSSGLMMSSFVSLVISVGVLLNRSNRKLLVGISIVVIFLLSYILGVQLNLDFLVIGLVTSSVVIYFLLELFFCRAKVGKSLVLLAAVVSLITVSSPHDFPATVGGYRSDPLYDEALFAYEPSSMDKASVLNQISQMLPSLPRDPGDIRVWFEPGSKFDQLSAPLLWYKSALQAPSDPGPPTISEYSEHILRSLRPRFIVIVDGSKERVNAGSDSLRETNLYRSVWTRTFATSSFTVNVAVLEIESFK